MSADSDRRQIESVNRDIGQLHGKLADSRKKEADKTSRIGQIQRGISKSTSASTVQSKLREISGINRDIEQCKKQQADLTKQIADKEKKKHGYEKSLMKELGSQQQTFERAQQRRLESYRSGLMSALVPVVEGVDHSIVDQPLAAPKLAHDVFISHASEDKDDFVRQLADALTACGLRVWYDEFVLKVGDSLRRSIDRGLSDSRYGIVVLSSAFFAKNWPQYELDGLVTKEMSSGDKVILPIWHKVSKDEVSGYSPTLADKVALNTGLLALTEIVDQLIDVILPNRGQQVSSERDDLPSASSPRPAFGAPHFREGLPDSIDATEEQWLEELGYGV